MLLQTLWALGAVYLLYKLSAICHLHFIHSSTLRRYRHSAGSNDRAWALVTGASDGIGKGFATQLCRRGFNVVIHGRNQSKLQGVADDLQRQYPGVSVRLAVLDAHPITEELLDAMIAGFDDLDITVLINNVGGSGPVNPIFRDLEALSYSDISTLLAINISFPTALTAKFLAKRRGRQGPTLIMNTGSFTGGMQSPYLSVYAGTKAYIESWSRSVACEMKADGRDVEIIGLIIGEVAASFDREKPTSFTRPSSLDFAGTALDKVGCGQRVITPYIGHALPILAMRLMPEWLADKILIGIAKQLKERDEQLVEKQL